MKWMNRLLLSGVVFLLPLIVLTGAVNLIARVPDFYQYEFNRNDVSREMRLSVNNADLATVFSDFMWGKTDELILESEYMGTEEEGNLFLPIEQSAMKRLRTILNVLSLVNAVAFIPVVAGYYLLIREGGKEWVRRAFLLSVPVLLVYGGICAVGLSYSKFAATLRDFFVGGAFPVDSLLSGIFTREFVLQGALISACIAVIVYIILGMVTWSLTRPYRMFGPERRP